MKDLRSLLGDLDVRIRRLERQPDEEVRAEVATVLQLIDRLHRPLLGRLAERLRDGGLWDAVLEDEDLFTLFALYDLVELDDVEQAEIALEAVRPYIRSHGGEVEVLEVDGGDVHLRLRGACARCAAAAATLARGVETALREGLSGFRRLVVHPPEASGRPGSPEPPVFRELLPLAELGDRAPKVVAAGGKSVLLVRLGDEVHACDPACPACGAALARAKVNGRVVVCPGRDCAFDLASGRRADGGDGPGLRAYPVAAAGGRVLLASGVAPAPLFTPP